LTGGTSGRRARYTPAAAGGAAAPRRTSPQARLSPLAGRPSGTPHRAGGPSTKVLAPVLVLRREFWRFRIREQVQRPPAPLSLPGRRRPGWP